MPSAATDDSWCSNPTACWYRGDTNGFRDIYVRDLTAKTTTRASLTSTSAQIYRGSSRPKISADGSRVTFDSGPNTASSGDNNSASDVFLRNLKLNATPPGVGQQGPPQRRHLRHDQRQRAAHRFLSTAALAGTDANATDDAYSFTFGSGDVTPPRVVFSSNFAVVTNGSGIARCWSTVCRGIWTRPTESACRGWTTRAGVGTAPALRTSLRLSSPWIQHGVRDPSLWASAGGRRRPACRRLCTIVVSTSMVGGVLRSTPAEGRRRASNVIVAAMTHQLLQAICRSKPRLHGLDVDLAGRQHAGQRARPSAIGSENSVSNSTNPVPVRGFTDTFSIPDVRPRPSGTRTHHQGIIWGR